MRRLCVVAVALLAGSMLAGAYPSGISGRTQKNTTAGCGGGSCHGSGASSSVTVSIAGPETVLVGQTASYTITVTGSTGSNGGVDIAAFSGTLAPASSTLKLLNGDVVHKQRVSSPFTYAVTYTAPATAGTDTIYATGKDNVFSGWNWSPKKKLTILNLTGVGEPGASVPSANRLLQNYPNPFNPATIIRYALRSAEHVTLRVFDVSGRTVATLVNGPVEAGEHALTFDGTGLASGLYLYRLEVGGIPPVTRKMVLMR